MHISSKRIFILLIIFGMILSLLFGIFFYDKETKNIKLHLQKDVKHEMLTIKRELQLNFESLYILKGLFDGSSSVSINEFNLVSKSIIKKHKNIKSLYWLNINDKINKNNLNVKYVYPYNRSSIQPGFNLYSNKVFTNYFTHALKEELDFYMSSIDLSVELLRQKRLLVFLPTYKENLEKEKVLKGFILCEFDIDDILNDVINLSDIDGLNTIVLDVNGDDIVTLYNKRIYKQEDKNFRVENILKNIGGRQWNIILTPSLEYVSSNRTVFPYFIGLTGVVFLFFASFYTFSIIKRNIIVASLVREKTKELSKVNRKLKEISRTDALTNVANRRYCNEYLQSEWDRSLRVKMPISIIMIDIDYFKQYNDSYGHLCGDKCLQDVAASLKNSIHRAGDFLARFGGEEFIMILPNTKDAFALANKIVRDIENLKIEHESSQVSQYVTISAGIINFIPNKNQKLLSFVNKADEALYDAKAKGRNQVAFYENNSINSHNT